MDCEDSFYVTLPSNVDGDGVVKITGKNNSLSSWSTQLRQWIHLDGHYEVGLAEFSYTKSWFTINTRQEITLCLIEGICLYGFNLQFIEPGVYPDIRSLIDTIQDSLNAIKLEWIERPLIQLAESGVEVEILPGKIKDGEIFGGLDVYPKFGEELTGILGIPPFKVRSEFNSSDDYFEYYEEKVKPHYLGIFKVDHPLKTVTPYDLRAGIHSLFVYTDIIKHRYVGNTMAQLLRKIEVPNESKFGDQINLIYERPHYHPIISPSICSIEITIRDDTDTPIQFKFGRCFAVLHFRRISYQNE